MAAHHCFNGTLGGVSGGNVTPTGGEITPPRSSALGKVGSAKLPMATVTWPGKPSFSQKTVEPHVGQKSKVIALPLSAVRVPRRGPTGKGTDRAQSAPACW